MFITYPVMLAQHDTANKRPCPLRRSMYMKSGRSGCTIERLSCCDVGLIVVSYDCYVSSIAMIDYEISSCLPLLYNREDMISSVQR